jgi:lincosamide nucleotidyltransferase A/C/D/E
VPLSARAAAEILDRLDAADVWYCLEGGWGVDALLEQQTREHGDLDVGVRSQDVDRVCAALPEFAVNRDEWPSRLVLQDARGRAVDCHPLAFDDRGDGWQSGPRGERYRWPREHLDARGRIHGRDVRCISAELQLLWHEHEGFDDIDWHDVRVLCDRFALEARPGQAARPGFVAPRRGGGAAAPIP